MRSRVLRLAVVGTVVLAIVGLAYALAAAHERIALPPATAPAVTSAAAPTLPLDDVARASISRVITVEGLRNDAESLGTAWLLDTRGDFVTNAHVLTGQLGLRLRDRDGHTHLAVVLGVDDAEDIALLRSADGFGGPALRIASATAAAPQGVVVIASGEATGKPDVTVETLTGRHPDVPVQGNPDLDPGTSQASRVYRQMIELRGARVYQGNSGGPVLDANGLVVGILSLASKSGDLSYAIPIGRVLPELLRWGAR